MAAPFSDEDDLGQFLKEARKMIREAEIISQAVPNADVASLERAARQIYAIGIVLQQVDDPFLDEEVLDDMHRELHTLRTFLENAALARSSGTVPPPHAIPTDSVGRPRFDIDLDKCERLHDLGSSWTEIADAFGVTRQTLHNHMTQAGRSTSRPAHTAISDDDLDELIASISIDHPFIGQSIMLGHLKAQGYNIPRERVQESFRRVDAAGIAIRWSGVIKRRVYRVRGANALWHQDGNEKLRPWGFYVHGNIDGYSRLILYLVCCSNKRSATVYAAFSKAVHKYEWPSRVHGDFGKENNGIETAMQAHWGMGHHSYLRGRSTQNIRIERLWRDVRKDTLEVFRQTFQHLEELGHLDMDNPVHRAALYLTYQPRIQASLDRTREAWNLHKIRTAHHRTPTALYELSRTKAINGNYWHTDPGDELHEADNLEYGLDPHAPIPPADEVAEDATENDGNEDVTHRGASLATDAEFEVAAEYLKDVDLQEDDDQWGVTIYRRAIQVLEAGLAASA